MFKLLVLQFLYDLSDRELEEAARDRIGPDTIKQLFDDLVLVAASRGFVIDRLSLVDATAVKAKVDVYKLKKKGPDDPPDGSGRGGPDPDARWGKKSEKKARFGYKALAAVDDGSELITKIEVSAANFELIRESGQRRRSFRRRSGPGAKSRFVALRACGATILLSDEEAPSRAEHKFAEGKRWHDLGVARYWGVVKVRFQVYMTAQAFNLKRLVTLEWGEAGWEAA